MVQYDFDDTVAFVTGAARGQGRSHAVSYAKHGADVVVTDICRDIPSNPYHLGTEAELDETAQRVEDEGSDVLSYRVDVRDEDEVAAAVEDTLDQFGRIDVLANNAGIWNISDLVGLDEPQWHHVVETNLKGAWLCAKHVGKHFVDRGEGGKIVSTSSTAGLTGIVGSGHYAAAKHGVVGLTKTLALELAEYGVNVNCVCPTAIDTPLVDEVVETYGSESVERLGEVAGPFNVFEPGTNLEPEAVSEAFMWLSSDAARNVTGVALPVDAGFTAK
jgi:SDR family mycofactocin-dependent oxidoreductase